MAIPAMVASLLGGAEGIAAWGIAFIAGLLMAAPILALWSVTTVAGSATAKVGAVGQTWPAMIVGGLLIVYRARLARAGSQGDGVVALSRGSRRSIVALLAIATGGAIAVLGEALVTGADAAPGGVA